MDSGESTKTTDIELVVTDLDGTLWDANQQVDKRSFEAIAQLQDMNISLLAATARGPRSTFEAFERLVLGISECRVP